MDWIDVALKQIATQCIPHREYARVLSEALSMLSIAYDGEVLCITGPSRVGKSRIASEVARLATGATDFSEDGLMPVVYVDAENVAMEGTFSSKHFTFQILQALEHPIYGVPKPDDKWGVELARLIHNTPEWTLNASLDHALKIRKTKYLCIDELHHILYARRGEAEAAAILDAWKCRARKLGLVLIFVGAYPMLKVLGLTPHLIARKHQLHLARYSMSREDLLVFYQILDFYSSFLKFPPGVTSLRDWAPLLYQETFGCIGLLLTWLRRALALAKTEGSKFLRKELVMRTRQSKAELASIASEIREGEDALRASECDGVEPDVARVSSDEESIQTSKRKVKSRGRPFQRKPRRYKLGGRV